MRWRDCVDRKYNKAIVHTAKALRKNMTREERHLWYDFLRKYPVKFQRQKVLGKYIVDFYSAEANLIIEVDGAQHYEEKGYHKDVERTMYLEQYGLKVIRILNSDINTNFDGVCEYIDYLIKRNNPSVSFADSSLYTREPEK